MTGSCLGLGLHWPLQSLLLGKVHKHPKVGGLSTTVGQLRALELL